MLVVSRSAFAVSLLVLLGCAAPAMSPIQRIKETLAMAENYQKIEQDVLDWYEAHPGETATIVVSMEFEYERERETSPQSAESSALNRRRNEIIEDAWERGQPRTAEEWEEIRRLGQEAKRLRALAEEDIREIRERNDRLRSEAYAPVWAAALEQLQRIKGIELVEAQYPEPHVTPYIITAADHLGRITAIPEITRVSYLGKPKLGIDVTRSVIGANVVQNQLGITGTGVRVAVIDTGIHGGNAEPGLPPNEPAYESRIVAKQYSWDQCYSNQGPDPWNPSEQISLGLPLETREYGKVLMELLGLSA